ncbi:MAG TPA: tetratricopeptide repeat protein [Anaerolineae bacterium]|nr:tetratricopeptide repeat protein [Anaerolineae bacterium]
MHQLIPQFVAHQYENGHITGTLTATTLFIDISGFTPITQILMTHGKEGAEQLAAILNDIFSPIITTIYHYDGFISSFSGDAFTAIFPQPTPPINALHAVYTIRQLFQQQITPHQNHNIQFALKQGLASGAVTWQIIGTDQRQAYFFTGPAIEQAIQAEQIAQANDIILHTTLQQQLPTTIIYHQRQPDYAQLLTLPTTPPPPTSAPPPATIPTTAHQFFPAHLWEMPHQAEFRDVSTIFISFQNKNLDQFIPQVMHATSQFGGYFNKVNFDDKGGTILILFGAPTAHEDNQQRALDFILTLQDQSNATIWRAGITHGTIYAGFVGSPQRDEYTGLGTVVNLAARLMMRADWGQILVSKPVALHPGFDFVALGALPYKGFDRNIPTYRLTNKTIESQVFAQQMVGRDDQLNQLIQFAQPLFNGQRAGVAIIYGPAGIGKSHLVFALGQKIGPRTRWLRAQTDPILQQAFSPFVYALRDYFGQIASATTQANKDAFHHRLQDLTNHLTTLPHSQRQRDELQRTHSLLGALLGLHWPNSLYEQLSAEGRYQNTLIAISMLIQAECRRQPIILEIEDGQWLDDASQAMLHTLTRQTNNAPLLILITSRYHDDGSPPTYQLAPDTPTHTIELDNLPPESVRTLAQNTLGHPIDDTLHQLLLDKTNATPFFIQQILYYLQQQDALVLLSNRQLPTYTLAKQIPTLPATLNNLLIARLDRLDQQVKQVIQTAAVLGREFESRLLYQILQRDIASEIDIATQEQIWALLNDLQYIFKHALMRDAAYEMQLRARLRDIHYLAAQTGEKLYADQLDDYCGTLAYHYDNAYQLGATDAYIKACLYLNQLGHQALDRYQHAVAINAFTRALAITPATDTQAIFQLLTAREQAYDQQGQRDEQLADLDRLATLTIPSSIQTQLTITLRYAHHATAISQYEQVKQYVEQIINTTPPPAPVILAEAYWLWGNTLRQQGQMAAAHHKYEYALAYAQQSQNQQQIANSLNGLGNTAIHQTQYATAQTYLEQALTIWQKLGNKHGQGANYHSLGNLGWYQADFDNSQKYYQAALEIRRQIGDRYGEAASLNNLGAVNWFQGRYNVAQKYYEQAYLIQQEIGNLQGMGAGLNNLGNAATMQGDYPAAQTYYEQALAIRRQIKNRNGEAISLNNLGAVLHRQQKYSAANDHYQQALTLWREIKNEQAEGSTLTSLGQLAIDQQNYDDAHHYYQAALKIHEKMDQPHLLVEDWAGLAKIHLAHNQHTLSQQYAEKVAHYYLEEGGDPGQAEDHLCALRFAWEVLTTLGHPTAPHALLTLAIDYINKHLAKNNDPQQQERYLQQPHHHILWTAWQTQQGATHA